ncbi:MAG: hypothetical protein ACRD88_23070 [Terriglobia bacterium]
MKVAFNLASHPYENLRPYYTVAWIAVAVALLLALALISRERQQRSETRSLTQQLSRFDREVQDLEGEQRDLEAWLRRPEVQEIRDRSGFLNSMIFRKSLSWTRMFLDLEKILPARAQVISIQPRLSTPQQAELALTVTSTEMGPLVELLKNLESSSQFGAPAVESQRFLTDRSQQTRIALDLRTQYRQALPEAAPVAPSAEAPAAADAAVIAQQARREGGR